MDKKKMLNRINEAVQLPAGASFDDIRARIEAQTEQQREKSSNDTLRLLEGKSGNAYGMKRIAAFAASAVVIIGLGAVLIASGTGSMSDNTAASESVVMDSVVSETVENDSEKYNFSDEPVDEMTDGASTEATTETHDEIMDGTEIFSDSTASENTAAVGGSDVEYVTHAVGTVGISIDLPADAYVTDRSVSPDFELLEVYDMSAAQLEANYKTRDIYYNAMWYDTDADVTEIVISMKTDDISANIFDLNSANEEQLAEIEKLYSNYEVSIDAVVGAKYYDVSLVEHDQALFFRAEGVVSNRSGRSNHLQYMTIINGYRVEITLIEHFGIENELTGEEPEQISAGHSKMMERVISSVRWERVRSAFWHHNRGIIFYGLIVLAGAAAIVAVLLLPENRKGLSRNRTGEAEDSGSVPNESAQEGSPDSDDEITEPVTSAEADITVDDDHTEQK